MSAHHDLTLVLVRHGETEGESSIRYHGRNDVRLSELGRVQMRAARRELESRFGDLRFDRVFATPLSRAREGAQIIAGFDALIVSIADFIEVHFGLFEGLTREEIQERHPIEFEKWRADPLAASYTYPQGESRAAFTERVEFGLTTMLKVIDASRRAEHERILIVAHRGVIRTIVRALSGAEPIVDLGSIHIVARERDRKWHPLVLDFTAHLELIK
ncbi:MAG TPA: histidine phosphatase family protein [Candidatus Binataceae bacterium]|nr:histidine phosphatase family protein [Candidatus Binataceae bacterium]